MGLPGNSSFLILGKTTFRFVFVLFCPYGDNLAPALALSPLFSAVKDLSLLRLVQLLPSNFVARTGASAFKMIRVQNLRVTILSK